VLKVVKEQHVLYFFLLRYVIHTLLKFNLVDMALQTYGDF